MKVRFAHQAMIATLVICRLSACFAAETSDANESTKYLDAVRTFADNVLNYGRDTYGPKHTPLFVDGLNIHTHEPVKWIAPNGDRLILSNLTSQQNLFRTLDSLTKITGDPRYRQAAMDAIKYAFENLRSPNGLFFWGGHAAYDAGTDKPCGRHTHELKAFYPYYELMWKVDPQATRKFIEAFWSAHILDWSNLDMDRHASLSESFVVPWKHAYKGGAVFFESRGFSPVNTGSDLFYAAAMLTKLSGENEPLVWGKRLASRYVETRNPKTAFSSPVFTVMRGQGIQAHSKEEVLSKLVPVAYIFPYQGYANRALWKCHFGYDTPTPGIFLNGLSAVCICQLMLGDLLGDEGKEFTQWAIEELTAWGKVAYRSSDNAFVPMCLDGTNLEGYVCKEDGPLGFKGTVLEPVTAGSTEFWAYALAYCQTDSEFMWEMTRNIARGNNYGDLGASVAEEPQLNLQTNLSNPYVIIVFLELYKKTGKKPFLEIARRIGDNVLINRFHKGFFLASNKHTYSKIDAIDSLTLLHLHLALTGDKNTEIQKVWPATSFFEASYRRKDPVDDNQIIYTLRGLFEPPKSLQEAAAEGDLKAIRSMIGQGIPVDGREDGFWKTALHRAAMSGHKGVVKVLLANGADTDARDSFIASSLHYAAEKGHKDIAELLIAHGADVDAENASGDTPMQYAAFYDRHDTIKLLLEKGATISNIHLAAYMGDLAKLDVFIQEGVGINNLDGHGHAPLHYAAQNGQKEAVELLIAKGADVNVKDWNGQAPLSIAAKGGQKDIVELLITHGADINAKNNQGMTAMLWAVQKNHQDIAKLLITKGADINERSAKGHTPLHFVVSYGHKDIVELLIVKGADVNAKNNDGQRPLDLAMILNRKGIFELLLEGGAELSMHTVAYLGDIDMVRSFIEAGTSINGEPLRGAITPLYWAIRENHEDVAELLIEKGANVQVKGWRGWTPLHYAAREGNRDMVELLITKGADVNAKLRSGKTALILAKENAHTDIVELLRSCGAK
ncbi:MAG: ankyrin repeat domain-containing protein [Planctomycetota bacterium]|jgi:pectate lyase